MENDFTEIRLHKEKPPQEFSCKLLHREKDSVVLYYPVQSPARIKDILIEKGSSTIAHYWENRNYVLWKFISADHRLLGYLFHVCNKTEIGSTFVRYEDLELDIWFDPDGTAIVLDQDEVNDCSRRGLIDSRERALIEQQKGHILKNVTTIIQSIWTEDE
jgi:predicted RNA-binding protein associated with RNAse of E/G family